MDCSNWADFIMSAHYSHYQNTIHPLLVIIIMALPNNIGSGIYNVSEGSFIVITIMNYH